MLGRFNSVLISIVACSSCLFSTTAGAQTSVDEFSAAAWNGTWLAQGTLFSVAVTVQNGEFRVNEVQSMGFVWTSQPGNVNGSEATVQVSYAGATATLLARLTSDGIAVVEAATCAPEFMVVCALARGQQATFIRQAEQ
jgi:hypothetical protein